MKKTIQSLRMAFVLMLLCGLIFPVFLTSVSGLVFPSQAQGSLLYEDGEVIGSRLIAQDFNDGRYLSGRPYADLEGVSGSDNWAISSPEYAQEFKNRLARFIEKNETISVSEIPMELLSASGSSLDPHLSKQGALVQVDRMSKYNGIGQDELIKIIESNTDGFGLVNVLEVNIAIYKILN